MRKLYGQKTFRINRNISIDCAIQNTSYGFRHTAELTVTSGTGYSYRNRSTEAKCCYYNRTWESFQFESVLEKVVAQAKEDGILSVGQWRKCVKYIKNGARVEDDLKPLKQLGAIASLGDIFFGGNQKKSNDFKTGVLKAGLGQSLDLPEDWGTLSEAEKAKRLDGVTNILS